MTRPGPLPTLGDLLGTVDAAVTRRTQFVSLRDWIDACGPRFVPQLREDVMGDDAAVLKSAFDSEMARRGDPRRARLVPTPKQVRR